MEPLIFKLFKLIIVFISGLLFCFFILLLCRFPLYYDIEESTGRHVFRNKKKKTKVYPNKIRWFFLLDYLPHIKRWHYVFFILDILLSIIMISIFTYITVVGGRPFFEEVYKIVFLIWMLLNIFILSFPTYKHRKKE